mgnify:CR=1 FL=1
MKRPTRAPRIFDPGSVPARALRIFDPRNWCLKHHASRSRCKCAPGGKAPPIRSTRRRTLRSHGPRISACYACRHAHFLATSGALCPACGEPWAAPSVFIVGPSFPPGPEGAALLEIWLLGQHVQLCNKRGVGCGACHEALALGLQIPS